MLTDERYGHQLGVRLRQELEDVHASPGLVSALRRQQARRTWSIRTAIATPVVAVAAAALLVTTVGQGVPGEGRPADGTVRFENVAQVQEQTLKALGRATEYVIYARNTYDGGYYDEWTDKATQRYRNDVYDSSVRASVPPGGKGQAPPAPTDRTRGPIRLSQSHLVTGPEGDQDGVTVDYLLKQWWTGPLPDEDPTGMPDITDPESIREAITDGTVELVGKEKVDGVDTLHLQLFGPHRSYRIDMWVDETTYLPVQGTAVKRIGGQGPGEFPAAATVTTRYSWLPRTAENLRHLELTPPPGFTEQK
ncbi:hypothetical protein [Plantactinospora sp. B5E13]|uniref:hypothetical protein n=1 Tax=unclassified Plantactinospora TaxID=2631981 RepID=UPI00325EDAC8